MLPTSEMITSALAAIEADGGDPMQPTQILDQDGYMLATVQRLSSGTISVAVPDTPTRSLSSVLQSVTGFIDKAAGTFSNIATALQKTGNAIQGGAAGAQTGWNLPTTFTPYLIIGGALLVGGMLLSGRRR
jgi:hypothetical protein